MYIISLTEPQSFIQAAFWGNSFPEALEISNFRNPYDGFLTPDSL